MALASLEEAALAALDAMTSEGVRPEEIEKARNQLRARLVFDADGVTNLAHQLGYFSTIGNLEVYWDLLARVLAVTDEDVTRVAKRYLRAENRTVGWFQAESDRPDAEPEERRFSS